jgi:hypothetical protein
MRDVSDKICSENKNTPFLFLEKLTFYEIVWKRYDRPDKPQMNI